MQPLYLEPHSPLVFPDPRQADSEGLVAVGGDLSPERLLLAYGRGIFPWYDEGVPPLWWSPDPRAVLQVETLHVPRSLERRVRRDDFRVTWNRSFDEVMHRCARGREEGTWIIPEMIGAYRSLHELGHAHSIEVWEDEELIGGLYGVQHGGLFAGESMFYSRTDASKIALVSCVRSVFDAGIELFDVQFMTPHLAFMGAKSWPRIRYLETLAEVRDKVVDLSQLEVDWKP